MKAELVHFQLTVWKVPLFINPLPSSISLGIINKICPPSVPSYSGFVFFPSVSPIYSSHSTNAGFIVFLLSCLATPLPRASALFPLAILGLHITFCMQILQPLLRNAWWCCLTINSPVSQETHTPGPSGGAHPISCSPEELPRICAAPLPTDFDATFGCEHHGYLNSGSLHFFPIPSSPSFMH